MLRPPLPPSRRPLQRQAEIELEVARRRALGKPVTVESFLAWRSAFNAEMEALNGPRLDDEFAGKPTGEVTVVAFVMARAGGVAVSCVRCVLGRQAIHVFLLCHHARPGRQLFEQGKASNTTGNLCGYGARMVFVPLVVPAGARGCWCRCFLLAVGKPAFLIAFPQLATTRTRRFQTTRRRMRVQGRALPSRY